MSTCSPGRAGAGGHVLQHRPDDRVAVSRRPGRVQHAEREAGDAAASRTTLRPSGCIGEPPLGQLRGCRAFEPLDIASTVRWSSGPAGTTAAEPGRAARKRGQRAAYGAGRAAAGRRCWRSGPWSPRSPATTWSWMTGAAGGTAPASGARTRRPAPPGPGRAGSGPCGPRPTNGRCPATSHTRARRAARPRGAGPRWSARPSAQAASPRHGPRSAPPRAATPAARRRGRARRRGCRAPVLAAAASASSARASGWPRESGTSVGCRWGGTPHRVRNSPLSVR